MITVGAAPAPSGGTVADKQADDTVESTAGTLIGRETDFGIKFIAIYSYRTRAIGQFNQFFSYFPGIWQIFGRYLANSCLADAPDRLHRRVRCNLSHNRSPQ